MKRRILLLLLCLSLFVSGFSVSAEQTTEPVTETQPETETSPQENPVIQNLRSQLTNQIHTEDQRLRQQIMRIHCMTLEQTKLDSLGGRCGTQVAWELYLLGIDKYLVTNNGKDHFDYYKDAGCTSGGYPIRAYSVQDYSLEEALNTICRNGTRNVYNILVGFEKTNTEAGQQFGHAIFIHAILNGKIYCTEGYTTRFGTAEGEPIVVSIAQFVEWVNVWTEYEGLIYFGKGNALDSFVSYPCDMFVQCKSVQNITTEPGGAQLDRTVRPGERLHVTGMFEDLAGSFYYRMDDNGKTGYVQAEFFLPVLFNDSAVTATELVLPETLQEGERFLPGGQITAPNAQWSQVRLVISDPAGQVVMECEAAKEGAKCDLGSAQVRNTLDTRSLAAGTYVYGVYAHMQQRYLQDGKVETHTGTLCVAEKIFTVGQTEQARNVTLSITKAPAQEGWNYIDGQWYYYENGSPRTGWFCDQAHDYYMDENGAAVTGWQEINGKMRYFGQTGALRCGWLNADDGVYYLLRNGVITQGWRTIDGDKYCFDQTGKLYCGGWTELEGKLYYFYGDGKAATGWTELNGVNYSFHADGYLMAKRLEEDGQTQFVTYDGTWKPE